MEERRGVLGGRERVCVRVVMWEGERVGWRGGGRPQRKRLARVEREGARFLEAEGGGWRAEGAGEEVGGRMEEVEEVEGRKLDVEVAEVGGRRVEVVEGGVVPRLVEAERMSFDMDVAAVTVDARIMDALAFREEWYSVGVVEAVDDVEPV